MSKDYEITIDGHPNIYNNLSTRSLNIYFSEPEYGITEETGIMINIPGFGGNANSNIYKKMRTYFADKFNFVAIQCDYFGLEFMQTENLKETNESFNDMGPLQAMDIISSVIIVQEIIKDNGLVYNKDKIIAYGHSHGAYLAYLANVFAPNLFSLIIDNSSWLVPVYLVANRELKTVDQVKVFDYYVKYIDHFDLEIYDLRRHYKKQKNHCLIYSFHGDNDNLISLSDKKKFVLPLKKCSLKIITRDNTNDIFRSNNHGLDADFIKMFEYVLMELKPKFKKSNKAAPSTHRIETSKFSYLIDFTDTIPILSREWKHASDPNL